MNIDQQSLKNVNHNDDIELYKDGFELHKNDIKLRKLITEVHTEGTELHKEDIELHNEDIELHKDGTELHKENVELHKVGTELCCDNILLHKEDNELQNKNIELHKDNSGYHKEDIVLLKKDIELYKKGNELHKGCNELHKECNELHKNAYAEFHQAVDIQLNQRTDEALHCGAHLYQVGNVEQQQRANDKFNETNQVSDVELNKEPVGKANQRDDVESNPRGNESNPRGKDELQQRPDDELHYKIYFKLPKDDEHSYSELVAYTNYLADQRADDIAKDIKINLDIDYKGTSDYEDIDSITAVAVNH